MIDYKNEILTMNYKADLYSWLAGYKSKKEVFKQRFKKNIIGHFLFKNN